MTQVMVLAYYHIIILYIIYAILALLLLLGNLLLQASF